MPAARHPQLQPTRRGSTSRVVALVVAMAVVVASASVGGLSPAPVSAATPPALAGTVVGGIHPGAGPAAAVPASQVAQYPTGVALRPAGAPTTAYVADPSARVVREIQLGSATETVHAGTGETGTTNGSRLTARFVEPVAVAVAPGGDLYVVDKGAHQVRRIAPGGAVTTAAGVGSPGASDGPAAQALFNRPVAAVAVGGDLYVADQGNGSIRRLRSGAVTTFATGLNAPSGLAVTPGGDALVVTEQGTSGQGRGPRVRRLEIASGTPSTIAGDGVGGFAGDGGAAGEARFFAPQGVVVAADGDVVVADTLNHRLRRIDAGADQVADASDTITTVAGTADAGFNGDGVASTRQLRSPWALATDGARVYVGDVLNGRVRVLDAGQLTTLAGPGVATATVAPAAAQLASPSGVAVVAGVVHVADTQNCVIRRLVGGLVELVAGTGTCGTAPLPGPATSSALRGPSGLVAVGTDLYLSDSDNHRVLRLRDGELTLVAGSPVGVPGPLNRPAGLAVQGSDLLIADAGNDRIARVPLTGGAPTTALAAGLSAPRDVAVAADGALLVADTGNNQVVRAQGGIVRVLAGNGAAGSSGDGGPALEAALDQPAAVAAGPEGLVYVADTLSNRVRVVTPAGTIHLLGGGDSAGGFAGDGGPAAAALFSLPAALVLDGDGDVLVADAGNDRVRQINALAVPGPPQGVQVVPASTSARVAFTPTPDDGGLPVVEYRATATPGGATCTWASGPTSGPPGCTLAGLAGGVAHTVAVVAVNAKGPSTPAVVGGVVPTGPDLYHPITPSRVFDTRTGQGVVGGAVGRMAPGQTRTVQFAGVAGLPTGGVSAVVVNLTATDTTGPGFATLYPADPRPGTSSLNWVAGRTVANQAVIAVDAQGRGRLYNHLTSSAHLVVDVVGWFDAAGGDGFSSISPSRILDSRNGTGTGGSTIPWGGGTTRTLQVTGGAVPGGVSAVVLNVTATSTTAASFLSVYPFGAPRPNASSLNWAPGQTVANQVTVPVDGSGRVTIYNHAGSAHVIADVVGYYDDGGAGFHPVTPTRLLDSRDGTGGQTTRWGSQQTRPLTVVGTYGSGVPQAGAAAVVVNATVTNTSNPGFLLLYPAGSARPNASTVNWTAGETRANLATTKVGDAGQISIFNHLAFTDVVVDVTGWYG